MGTPLPKWIRKLNVLMSELGFICIYAINAYSQYNIDSNYIDYIRYWTISDLYYRI